MVGEFFEDDANMAELVSHMPEEDQQRFKSYGHFRIEAVFADRIFIVYKPTGLTESKAHREPQVLTTIKVIDFSVDVHSGGSVLVEDMTTQQQLRLTHVPRKLFGYPIYASVPPRQSIRWDAREVQGKVWRSLSFAIMLKTRNRSDFYSAGNTYCETPNKFARLFPNVKGGGTFKF